MLDEEIVAIDPVGLCKLEPFDEIRIVETVAVAVLFVETADFIEEAPRHQVGKMVTVGGVMTVRNPATRDLVVDRADDHALPACRPMRGQRLP